MSEEEKEKYMDQITVKAETLIEALPYIRDFNNKIVVVKYGLAVRCSDKKLEESVIKDVALLKLVGMLPDNRSRWRKRDKQVDRQSRKRD